jgi:hypothetical protein
LKKIIDRSIGSYVNMSLLEGVGFKDGSLGDLLEDKEVSTTFLDRVGLKPDPGPKRGSQNPEKPLRGQVIDFWGEIAIHLLGRKGWEINQQPKGEEP